MLGRPKEKWSALSYPNSVASLSQYDISTPTYLPVWVSSSLIHPHGKPKYRSTCCQLLALAQRGTCFSVHSVTGMEHTRKRLGQLAASPGACGMLQMMAENDQACCSEDNDLRPCILTD